MKNLFLFCLVIAGILGILANPVYAFIGTPTINETYLTWPSFGNIVAHQDEINCRSVLRPVINIEINSSSDLQCETEPLIYGQWGHPIQYEINATIDYVTNNKVFTNNLFACTSSCSLNTVFCDLPKGDADFKIMRIAVFNYYPALKNRNGNVSCRYGGSGTTFNLTFANDAQTSLIMPSTTSIPFIYGAARYHYINNFDNSSEVTNRVSVSGGMAYNEVSEFLSSTTVLGETYTGIYHFGSGGQSGSNRYYNFIDTVDFDATPPNTRIYGAARSYALWSSYYGEVPTMSLNLKSGVLWRSLTADTTRWVSNNTLFSSPQTSGNLNVNLYHPSSYTTYAYVYLDYIRLYSFSFVNAVSWTLGNYTGASPVFIGYTFTDTADYSGLLQCSIFRNGNEGDSLFSFYSSLVSGTKNEWQAPLLPYGSYVAQTVCSPTGYPAAKFYTTAVNLNITSVRADQEIINDKTKAVFVGYVVNSSGTFPQNGINISVAQDGIYQEANCSTASALYRVSGANSVLSSCKVFPEFAKYPRNVTASFSNLTASTTITFYNTIKNEDALTRALGLNVGEKAGLYYALYDQIQNKLYIKFDKEISCSSDSILYIAGENDICQKPFCPVTYSVDSIPANVAGYNAYCDSANPCPTSELVCYVSSTTENITAGQCKLRYGLDAGATLTANSVFNIPAYEFTCNGTQTKYCTSANVVTGEKGFVVTCLANCQYTAAACDKECATDGTCSISIASTSTTPTTVIGANALTNFVLFQYPAAGVGIGISIMIGIWIMAQTGSPQIALMVMLLGIFGSLIIGYPPIISYLVFGFLLIALIVGAIFLFAGKSEG